MSGVAYLALAASDSLMPHTLELDRLSEWLSHSAGRIGVPNACFHLLSTDGTRVLCQAVSNSIRATHLAYGLDLTECAGIAEALAERKPVAIVDAPSDLRVAQVARERYGLASVLYQPVRLHSGREGVLILSDRVRRDWSDEDVAAAGHLADEISQVPGGERVDISPSTRDVRPLEPRAGASLGASLVDALPGQVFLVDENLLTIASSGSVQTGEDLNGQNSAVSMSELISDSDRGVEFRGALVDILNDELLAFEGLMRTVHGLWWVHAQRIPGEPRILVGVHVRAGVDLPESVRQSEESRRLESIGRLASSVAHELNNSLQIIRTSLCELKDGDHEEAIDSIEAATDRAARVTGDLLAFARRSPSVIERVDFPAWIQSIAGCLQRVVEPKCRLELSVEGAGDCAVDKAKLEMALVNLCKNARDASPEGCTVTIDVAKRDHLDRAPDFVVRVIDDGPGFAAEILPDLGTPFVTTKGLGQGTGLGLAIVLDIVAGLGGAVDFASQPGRGACVTVVLPVETDSEELRQPAEESENTGNGVRSVSAEPAATEPAKAPPVPSSLGRILVVEDEEPLQRMLAKILGRSGYEVSTVGTCADALGALGGDTIPFDVVLLDLTLPDGKGIRIFDSCRERGLPIPFVFMSGFAEEHVLLDALREGSRFLAKPFSASELLDAVRSSIPVEGGD